MSSVTVFIVPPLNVTLEVGNQLLGRCEGVGEFGSVNMPVIAFPRFVVVAENAYAMDDIGKSILEAMGRSFDGLGKPPQHEFRESRLGVCDARRDELDGFHVGDDNNMAIMLSNTPTVCGDGIAF
jgi:hypothetical protein